MKAGQPTNITMNQTQKTKKGMNIMKSSKIILAFALTAILCLASFATAFAAAEPDPTTITKAAITKVLKTPYGTIIPAGMSFEFDITAISVDDEDFDGDEKNMPEFGTVAIDYDGSQNLKDPVPPGHTAGICTYYLESADIFKDAKWPHAGVYVYEIVEKANTYDIKDPAHEVMTYSGAKYTLNVYVVEDDNNAGKYVIYAIGDFRTLTDEGTQGGEKVDPTPGGDGKDYFYSQMTFTNTYVKTNGGTDPENPDNSTLSISKAVTGDFGSKTKYFEFTLTVTAPSLVPGTPTYRAYIIEGGKVVGDPVDFVSGTPNKFELKHGQKLVFIDTPVGTYFTVKETASAGYVPNIALVYDGGTALETNNENASINFGTDEFGHDYDFVGEAENTVGFTNDRNDITPTGFNLNDLPFIGMIILALAGAAAFIIIKFRRRNSYR